MRPPSTLRWGCAPACALVVSFLLALVSPARTEPGCQTAWTLIREHSPQIRPADLTERPLGPVIAADGSCGCCSSNAAARLSSSARRELKNTVKVQATKLHTSFGSKAKHFDDVFLELLAQSKIDLHMMFTKTYGLIYEKHAQLFSSLFYELERYYKKGDIDLAEMIDNFFSVLYKKMFTVLNSQYNFDEKYLTCVSEHMRELQPFGDVPHKLAIQVKRSFVATRTFTRSLNAAAEVARTISNVQPANGCGMNDHCGMCSGVSEGPCPYLCINRIRACLPQHADLSLDWDTFVDAMDKVSDRLLGPFNIAVVVEPINVKISEAIMNFQERSQELSQRVFTGCGKPVLGQKPPDSAIFSHSRETRSAVNRRLKSSDNSDDFEIETSYESLLAKNPFLLSRGNSRKQFSDYDSNVDLKAKNRVNLKIDSNNLLENNFDLGSFKGSNRFVHDSIMRMRLRRDANPEPGVNSKEIDFETYDWENKRNNNRKKGNKEQGKGKKKKLPNSNRHGSGSELDNGGDLDHGSEQDDPLERLVRDIRKSVRESRHMWASLPQIHCNINQKVQLATLGNEEKCWNGSHVARYSLQLAGEGTAALATNPEAKGSSASTSSMTGVPTASVVTAQQFTLRSISNKLKNAYNGLDVEWGENEQISSWSLGSGSGSGDDTDDRSEPGGPIDNEDDTESSGQHPDTRFENTNPDKGTTDDHFNPSVVIKHPESDINMTDEEIDQNSIGLGNSPDHIDQNTRKDSGTSSASQKQEMSLQRALITYLFPIVCVWFGGIITDIA